jgi:hypothetical protein
MLKTQDHKHNYDRDELDYHTKIPKPRFQRAHIIKLRTADVEAMMKNTDEFDDYEERSS